MFRYISPIYKRTNEINFKFWNVCCNDYINSSWGLHIHRYNWHIEWVWSGLEIFISNVWLDTTNHTYALKDFCVRFFARLMKCKQKKLYENDGREMEASHGMNILNVKLVKSLLEHLHYVTYWRTPLDNRFNENEWSKQNIQRWIYMEWEKQF